MVNYKVWKRPTYLTIFTIILGLFALFLSGFFGLGGIVIGYICGEKCAEWSQMKNKNSSIAYLFGLLLGLLGLLIYYIYFKLSKP